MVFNGTETMFPTKNIKEIKLDNSKTLLDRFSISFLSFFYNFKLYILSYIFLFLFVINFKGKINHKVVFFGILFLGLILRITQLNAIPFWDDEIYTIVHASKNAPLEYLFNDPGNPPLYYILFKIYSTIFQNPDFYRFLSVIFGLVFNVCFYFYIKQALGKNKALIGMFIPTISVLMLYLSQQLRCYMLAALLALLTGLFLLKFNKNKVFYTISSVFLIYTHFYGALFVLYNFVFGFIIFRKNKKKIKNFIICNLIIMSAFLPVFIQKLTSLTTNFNSWLLPPSSGDYANVIATFCSVWIFFLLFLPLLFYVYKKTSKKEKLIIAYNFFAIVFVILIAALFSYLVKPIFFTRYFYIVQHCYFVLVCCIVTFRFKNLVINFLQFAFFFLAIGTLKFDRPNVYCNHHSFFDFVRHDIDYNKVNYIVVSDTIKEFDFGIKNAKILYLPVNIGIMEIGLNDYLVEPGIYYVHNLYLTREAVEKSDYIELYKSPLGVYIKVEYK